MSRLTGEQADEMFECIVKQITYFSDKQREKWDGKTQRIIDVLNQIIRPYRKRWTQTNSGNRRND